MANDHATAVSSNDAASNSYGEQQIQKLKAAEASWLTYRDLHCSAAEYEYDGGSIRPMIQAICLTTVTNNRIEEMKDAYEVRDKKLE